MDDMNAFERQLAGEVVSEMAPSRLVDAAAVFAAVDTTQSPKWRFQSMFSATKFVVAGVIVALFGGFLLAGALTTQQGDEVFPAAVTESPSPEITTAPTEPSEPVVRTDVLPGRPYRRPARRHLDRRGGRAGCLPGPE
jgi:hypothetical protein